MFLAYRLSLIAMLCFPVGCNQGTRLDISSLATTKQLAESNSKIINLEEKVANLKKEVKQLESRVPRWWKFVNDNDGEHSILVEGQNVDLKAALRNGLELIMNLGHSREEVIGFIQERFAVIWDKRVKLPVGGDIVKKHFQSDIADDINQLLSEPSRAKGQP